MELIFFVDRYDFSKLKKDAKFAADKVGVAGIVLAFDKLSSSMKSLLEEGEKAPLLERVPDDFGHQEMKRWNGLWLSSKNDPSWSFVATKWQVKDKDYWSITVELSAQKVDIDTMQSLFVELIESISPDLAFGYDEFAAPYNVSYFKNKLGPWAGLRDVYWLNYYGKKYAELVGIDTLKKIPQVLTVQDLKDGIFFLLDKGSLRGRNEVINQIGNGFFIRTSPSIGGAEEKVGILQLFKTIYSLSREKDNGGEIAKKRPSPD
jgi:hypothetical protein